MRKKKVGSKVWLISALMGVYVVLALIGYRLVGYLYDWLDGKTGAIYEEMKNICANIRQGYSVSVIVLGFIILAVMLLFGFITNKLVDPEKMTDEVENNEQKEYEN